MAVLRQILRRVLSALFTVAWTTVLIAVGINYYTAFSTPWNYVSMRTLPPEDFCYHVADVDRWHYNETVIDTRAKGSAWAEERLAAGQQNCYCNRYLLRGLDPSQEYTMRVSYPGPSMPRVTIAIAQVRQSRLQKLLSDPSYSHLQSEVPPEYGLTFPSSSRVAASHSSSVRGAHYTRPADTEISGFELRATTTPRVKHVEEVIVYDTEDVPHWVSEPRAFFFNWSSTLTRVSWDSIHFWRNVSARNISLTLFEREPFVGVQNVPQPNPWTLQTDGDDDKDPFLPMAEVCAGAELHILDHSPPSLYQGYNMLVAASEDKNNYAARLSVIVGLSLGLIQLVLFSSY